MNIGRTGRAVHRTLTTVNAPLAIHIDALALLSCLRLDNIDPRWRPHMRAFFREIAVDIIMDMVVEGAITFNDLARSVAYWNTEETESARWIREMASVTVADADDAHSEGDRLRILRR